MAKKPDGGPAFPTDGGTLMDGDVRRTLDGGMTLRDWFAGQAIAGLIASNDENAGDRITELPGYAYMIADAMLAEREKE